MAKHYYDAPDDPQNPGASALWGHVTAMLVEGGPWAGEPHSWEGIYEWVTNEGGKKAPRTKAKAVLVYNEAIYEPDPAISNLTFTAKLVRRMHNAGWSVKQVDAALSDEDNVGGAYYRWRCLYDRDDGVGLLQHLYEGSYPADHYRSDQLPTTSSPDDVVGSSTQERDAQPEVWKEWEGIDIRVKPCRKFLLYLSSRREVTMNVAEQSGKIHRRVFRRYVAALEDAGLLTVTSERRKTRDGKNRSVKVLRPTIGEYARLVLSAENIPEAERVLWEVLAPATREFKRDDPPPAMSSEEVSRMIDAHLRGDADRQSAAFCPSLSFKN